MSAPGFTFSVIIPTRDRPAALAACLEACAGQQVPAECFEVIVVNDGGRLPLEPVTAALAGRLNLTVLAQANAGPGQARNTGAAQARGRYLAFTDDDCAPAPDWLAELQKRLGGREDLLVGGRIENALPDNPYCAANQALHDLLYARLHDSANNKRYFSSNNLAVPAAGFAAQGGFYPDAAEDRDFCERWLRRGCEMAYAPTAVVSHAQFLNFNRFCQVHFIYGTGAFHFHQARSRRLGGPFRLYHYSLPSAVRYALVDQRQQFWPVGALMALAKAANALGFLTAAAQALLARTSGQPVPSLAWNQRIFQTSASITSSTTNSTSESGKPTRA